MYHTAQGKPTSQAHKGIPDGCFEEEQGHKGFFGPVSHLIKPKPSTRWKHIDGPLKPHMYDLPRLAAQSLPQRLLFNKDVVISFVWRDVSAENLKRAFRSADGDLLYFCHKGQGELFSEYGVLDYRKGHYILIPKSLTHSFVPSEPSEFLLIENHTSHFEQPERGLVGRHAIYDPQALKVPQLDRLHDRKHEIGLDVTEVVVQRQGAMTRFQYDECIYDTIGWKGDLFPCTLHVDDMMPLMSHRAHLPPSAHTTFVAREFVVCTFLPRPLESDQDALKVPFYHQNIDYDEVLFYHDGDFFSRDNLHAGMMSFHPAGFPHGPHPKAIEKVKSKTHTDEYAVMIDARWPLNVDPVLEKVEYLDYWKSWQKT